MKKIILILCILSLSNISCKKNRTCSCSVEFNGTSTTTASVDVLQVDTTFVTSIYNYRIDKITLEKTSKRKAKFNCISKSEPIYESTPTSIPGFLSVTTTKSGIEKRTCKLE